MIIESNNEEENNNSDLSIKNILLLGVATSIDALAVGIAYACAYGSNNAILTFTVIAIITFIFLPLVLFVLMCALIILPYIIMGLLSR